MAGGEGFRPERNILFFFFLSRVVWCVCVSVAQQLLFERHRAAMNKMQRRVNRFDEFEKNLLEER